MRRFSQMSEYFYRYFHVLLLRGCACQLFIERIYDDDDDDDDDADECDIVRPMCSCVLNSILVQQTHQQYTGSVCCTETESRQKTYAAKRHSDVSDDIPRDRDHVT